MVEARRCSNGDSSSRLGWYDALVVTTQSLHSLFADLNKRPESRDTICRDLKLHDKWEELANTCNDTMSINWPYNPADCLISLSSKEFVVNPVFIQHIRDLKNWTVGQSFFDSWVHKIQSVSGTVELTECECRFPELEHDLNIGRPRLGYG
jgi:hypothetical protein